MSAPRFHPPEYRVYELISKCVDDQFLLAPTDVCRFVVAFVLAAAQRLFDVEVVSLVVMSNHFHLIVRLHEDVIPDFVQYFKGQLGQRMNRLLDRRGAFWMERYGDEALLDDEAVLSRIHYGHANPLRAGLVERAEDWPGFSTYRAYEQGLSEITETYFDEPAWREKGAIEAEREKFTHMATVKVGRPPSWDGHSPIERAEAERGMVSNMREEERQMAAARDAERRPVPPVESHAKRDPRTRPARPKRRPKRKWASGSSELVAAHRAAYSAMLPAYRTASKRFRETGVMCPFPAGTYPPRIPRAFREL